MLRELLIQARRKPSASLKGSTPGEGAPMKRRTLITHLPLGLAGLGLCDAHAQTQNTITPVTQPARPANPLPAFDFPAPTLPITVLAEGLAFPEAPVVMDDGSVLFVQIESKQISRLAPNGKVTLVKQLEGGPNGLAIGPDHALYIANDGGRFSFAKRGQYNFPGAVPANFVGGSIQRLDLKTLELSTLYESCEGRRLIAPDDLVFDKAGGMYITDIGKGQNDGGVYYALPNGKGIRAVKRDMTAPNGIGVSPDGKLLHVSIGRMLMSFDIKAPGELAVSSSYPDATHAQLPERSIADSLKVLADGKVAVCTLIVGGISIFDAKGSNELINFADPMTTNLAFGGKDLRDTWVTLSGTGRIGQVRWPYPGLKPAFTA
jgi:gluconolactonase